MKVSIFSFFAIDNREGRELPLPAMRSKGSIRKVLQLRENALSCKRLIPVS